MDLAGFEDIEDTGILPFATDGVPSVENQDGPSADILKETASVENRDGPITTDAVPSVKNRDGPSCIDISGETPSVATDGVPSLEN